MEIVLGNRRPSIFPNFANPIMNSKGILTQRKIARYGWLPDLPDARDHLYAAPMEMLGAIPPKNCYADALKYKAVLYQRLTPVLSQLKGCLASGFPFVFGFTVYESFESAQVAKTGHAPLPKSNEQVIGSHAVVGVGYDDANRQIQIWRTISEPFASCNKIYQQKI